MIRAALLLLLLVPTQDRVNPEFEYWSGFKKGSWVRHRVEMDVDGVKTEYESTTRLVYATDERVGVETTMRTKSGGKVTDSAPSKQEILAKDPKQGRTLSEKDEEIEAAGKKLQCRRFEIEAESADKKSRVTIRAWMSREIPGGAARSEVTSAQTKVKTTVVEWVKQ